MGKKKNAIVETTLALGLSARKRKKSKEAADHFNRVLALDPGNEKALLAVAGMKRNRRARFFLERVAVVIPAIVALGAVVFGLVKRVDGMPTATGSEAPVLASVEIQTPKIDPEVLLPPVVKDFAEAASATVAPAVDGEVRSDKVQKGKKRSKSQSEMKPEEYREVMFTPYPMGVEIIIDGETRFPFGLKTRSKKLSVGEHEITFVPNDDKRFVKQTWVERIPEGMAPYQFKKRLQYRPAKIIVESNVDASVTIPGRVSDRANRTFPVDIENGPTEKLSILISRDGYIPQTKPITISAGELTKLSVTLAKTSDSP